MCIRTSTMATMLIILIAMHFWGLVYQFIIVSWYPEAEIWRQTFPLIMVHLLKIAKNRSNFRIWCFDKYQYCFPKIDIYHIFWSQPTSSVARWRISTICHHVAPIRTPKAQYKPLQQPRFAQPFSKWVNSSSAFLKLSIHIFPISTHLVCGQVM